jgi:hypothetical protein
MNQDSVKKPLISEAIHRKRDNRIERKEIPKEGLPTPIRVKDFEEEHGRK